MNPTLSFRSASVLVFIVLLKSHFKTSHNGLVLHFILMEQIELTSLKAKECAGYSCASSSSLKSHAFQQDEGNGIRISLCGLQLVARACSLGPRAAEFLFFELLNCSRAPFSQPCSTRDETLGTAICAAEEKGINTTLRVESSFPSLFFLILLQISIKHW